MALSVLIDWNGDGDYSDTLENVTSLVRRTAGVSVGYGRDQSTALAPTVAGGGSVILDNADRQFSPRNTSSVLYGYIKPARPVKITRTVGANTYTLFQGHTDDNPLNPDVNAKTVSVGLVDGLADLRGQNVTTGVYGGIRTGDAINLILDACGWSSSLRDIDSGATVIPWWWESNTDALTAVQKLVESEGPPAMVTQGVDGSIVFRDRHHRLQRANSVTSQATFTDVQATNRPYLSTTFVYDEAWRNIINTGAIDVNVRQTQATTTVWTADVKITLAAGEEKLITASSNDPFINAVTPVEATDYVLVSGAVTVSLLRDSGQAATIKLVGGGSGAVVQDLHLRARPIAVSHTIQVSDSDSQSVNDYGPRSLPTDPTWCDPATAQAVLSNAIALRAQPLPIVQASFICSSLTPDIANTILGLDLSDRVTLTETETTLNAVDFYIESISHEFTSEYDHRVTLGLEMATGQAITPLFRFDTAGAGFNDGKFGSGLDDPAATFEFDSTVSGHRFDEGRFVN